MIKRRYQSGIVHPIQGPFEDQLIFSSFMERNELNFSFLLVNLLIQTFVVCVGLERCDPRHRQLTTETGPLALAYLYHRNRDD